MTDWTKSTGATGTMMIRDTGTYVEFWLKAGSQTYNYDLPWAYVINGDSSGWKQFSFQPGGDWQRIYRKSVTTSQTVTFKLGDTGTSGLGGPTTFSHAISRTKVPNAPSFVSVTNLASRSFTATFKDGSNGGATIDSRDIGYGTNSSTPQNHVTLVGSWPSTWSNNIENLNPGQTYYFWARTHNSKGWSAWSARQTVVPAAVVHVKILNSWRAAIPYVNVNGVWKVAETWVRDSGVWKEAK